MFLALALVVVSGCGNQKAVPKSNPVGQEKSGEVVESSVSENLPVATGEVDDTVNAIVSGAEDESAQAVSDTNDAKAAVSDDAETNNLSNLYDQNEF